MHLVDPDILAAGQGLSPPLCGVGIVLGLVLWMLGGRGHRFWLVLLVTLSAGIHGLSLGESYGVQPLVAGLLLAIAAGALALSLVRLISFGAGGLSACLLAERLMPGWNEPFVFFFVGGFLGLFLLPLWMMALTSLTGALLVAYSSLWLIDSLGKLDATAFCADRPVLLDWACGGLALLGFLLQLALESRRRRKLRRNKDEEETIRDYPSPRRRLWGWGPPEPRRKGPGRRAA